MAKSPFLVRERNPDVLTSIANLSNDEVFTPPSFANKMLDTIEKSWAESKNGASIWEDKTVRFLDPFTKSGVFLREIVRRLNNGLASEMPNQQERINHILAKQVFGMAITNLTALTARRSVYCSKLANGRHSIATIFDNEDGSIWFARTEHTWVGGERKVITVDKDGKEVEKKLGGKCKHCGASQSEYEREDGLESHAYALIHTDNPKDLIKETFGEEMQFDVIIGNPPYQLNDGGFGTSAGPIYNKFVEQAIKLEPRYMSMVIPARWFTGGKGLDSFRELMLNDGRLRVLEDYPDSSQIFPGVQIKNGVCFFIWSRDEPGECRITNHVNGTSFGPVSRPLLEKDLKVFLRYNPAVNIVRKVMALENECSVDTTPFALPVNKRLSQFVSSRKPFGFDTTFLGGLPSKSRTLKIYRNSGVGFVEPSEVKSGKELIEGWKVFTPRASSGSDAFPHPILGNPFLGEPGSVSSETYLAIGPFGSENEALNVIKYLKSRFLRFMALQKKSSQDATRSIYELVPLQDFSKAWSDEELYRKYNFTQQEISFIESMVRSMELEDE